MDFCQWMAGEKRKACLAALVEDLWRETAVGQADQPLYLHFEVEYLQHIRWKCLPARA